jgi:hypothetical protein
MEEKLVNWKSNDPSNYLERSQRQDQQTKERSITSERPLGDEPQQSSILPTKQILQSSTTNTSDSSSFLPSQQDPASTNVPVSTTSLEEATRQVTTRITPDSLSNEQVSQATSRQTKRQGQIALDEEERKRMRLIKNRASAERSRRRQQQRLEELIFQVKCLRQQNLCLKQDHLQLLQYVDSLKTCMRQHGISVDTVPMPRLFYPSSDSLMEEMRTEAFSSNT